MMMRELFGWNQHFMHVRKECLHRMSVKIFNSGQDSDQDRNHTNVENLQSKQSTCMLSENMFFGGCSQSRERKELYVAKKEACIYI